MKFVPLRDVVKKTSRITRRNHKSNAVNSGFFLNSKSKLQFFNGYLYIIAGRPCMGKTAFLLSLIEYMAFKEKSRIGIINLASDHETLKTRMILAMSAVSLSKFHTHKFSPPEKNRITASSNKLKKADIWINRSPVCAGLEEITRDLYRLKKLYNIDIIFLDYLQLISAKNIKSAELFSRFKKVAVDLDIPFLIASQLSKKPENRKDHRPRMSDFRETNISAYSDGIIFIYREDYYTGKSSAQAKLIIPQNKDSITGCIKVQFNKDYGRVESLL